MNAHHRTLTAVVGQHRLVAGGRKIEDRQPPESEPGNAMKTSFPTSGPNTLSLKKNLEKLTPPVTELRPWSQADCGIWGAPFAQG